MNDKLIDAIMELLKTWNFEPRIDTDDDCYICISFPSNGWDSFKKYENLIHVIARDDLAWFDYSSNTQRIIIKKRNVKIMDFSDALKALNEGKKVRRKTMGDDAYIYRYGNTVFMGFESGGSQSYRFCYDDVTSDDWEVIEEIREAKVQTETREYYECPYCSWQNYTIEEEECDVCINCCKKVKMKREESKTEEEEETVGKGVFKISLPNMSSAYDLITKIDEEGNLITYFVYP